MVGLLARELAAAEGWPMTQRVPAEAGGSPWKLGRLETPLLKMIWIREREGATPTATQW